MATQIDLGAVVPIGKGDWDINTTYERANIVRHNSIAWICKVESSIGVEPTEDSSDWYLLVKDTSSVTSVNGQRGDVVIDVDISTIETPSYDDNSKKPVNSEWVRNATGNTNLNAASANKLATLNTGNINTPVFIQNGIPVACTPYGSASVNNSTKWNNASKTISTGSPSGGSNNDIWIQYIN